MGFPGTWMTESESMVYRVVPKCACSTIGQIMYFSDHGKFYDGDIHDSTSGLHKWNQEESKEPTTRVVESHSAYNFTCVRNPWTRILSCFFDKICGVQRNGNYYRQNQIPKLMQRYGVETAGDFDQIKSFRRFLLFTRDTIRNGNPMPADIHWSSVSGHVGTFVSNGGRFDKVISTEDFNAGMQEVLSHVETRHAVDLGNIPRFNESEGHGPKRAHPVEAYFDDLSIYIMHDIYRRDFKLFNYGMDPYAGPPKGEIDLDALHEKFGDGG
ncbi:sulfotransferase family protein [Paracoccaceae bacterium GXU_MW_L88]